MVISVVLSGCYYEAVSLNKKASHYEVFINLDIGADHYDIGYELGQLIAAEIPDIQAIFDSYITEVSGPYYDEFIRRVGDIAPQVQPEYLEEIRGLAAALSASDDNVPGDGVMSPDEWMLVNLFPDVARATQCSALGITSGLSEQTMVARNLDWYPGSQEQLPRLNAITVWKKNGKTVTSIGYLGFFSMLTGFNQDGVFGSVLDSPTGAPYSSDGKHSYVFDLRYALENHSDINGVADYMSFHDYTLNHTIFLADKVSSAVLENNISGEGADMDRALRFDDSDLNPGVEWNHPGAVVSVNSFVLDGNHDNHTPDPKQTARWSSLDFLLADAETDGTVTLDELRNIISYTKGETPGPQEQGDLYNFNPAEGLMTMQSVIYVPETQSLEVAFYQGGMPSSELIFEKINVSDIGPLCSEYEASSLSRKRK